LRFRSGALSWKNLLPAVIFRSTNSYHVKLRGISWLFGYGKSGGLIHSKETSQSGI
jgi:hypothetical protein